MNRSTLSVLGLATTAAAATLALTAGPGNAADPAGPPGQHAPGVVGHRASALSNPGETVCDGGPSHGIATVHGKEPLFWTSGTRTVSRKVYVSPKLGHETLVIGFDGEAYVDDSVAWLQADTYVDGVQLNDGSGTPDAFKSGATYADASLTRCQRVAPGWHTVKIVLSPAGGDGTGTLWVDDYTLKVEQFG